MLIVQVTDTHIVEKGAKTLDVAPMATNLTKCIKHINQLDPAPDVVLVTGDLTHTGSMDETINAARLLRKLDCPYYIVPGNHDDPASLWSVFGGQACPSKAGGFIAYVIDDFDVRLIGIDSSNHHGIPMQESLQREDLALTSIPVPHAPGGEVCETRAAWLNRRLAENQTKPTIIFMHHPPIMCSVPETDKDGFIGSNMLGDIIGRYDNIERIICGHIHLTIHARWHGTIVSTAPSTGMLMDLDLTMTKVSKFSLEVPAYQLHHWTEQDNLVTHTIQVQRARRHYLFEKSQDFDTSQNT